MTTESPWRFAGVKEPVASARRIERGTDQQEALWDDLVSAKNNILVEARAGSGKSSSCREGMFRMLDTKPGTEIRYTVFNKQNADEFRDSCPPGVSVGTCHSMGLQALRRSTNAHIDIDPNKSYVLLDSLPGAEKVQRWLRKAVSSVVSLAKNMALRPEQADLAGKLSQLIEVFDVRCYRRQAEVIDLAGRVLDRSAKRTEMVDFDDMIWLPTILSVDYLPSAVTFVDEVQDFNPAQHELIPIISGGGRVIAVGDRHQAIYAFRGADPDSVPRLKKWMTATESGVLERRLTVSFRCPKSHIALAQELVPDIRAHQGNAEGVVQKDLPLEVAMAMVTPKDMVLCYRNAPLISAALGLIRERRRCVVRGRAIGDSLLAVYRNCPGSTIAERAKGVDDWACTELNRLSLRDGMENVEDGVRDRAASLQAVLSACSSLSDVEPMIGSLFTEERSTALGTIFSTVHRAKGLEARSIYLLETPGREGGTEWQAQQDRNLRYVALTRSKHFLGFVNQVSEERKR